MRDKVTSKDSIHTMAHVAVHGNLVFASNRGMDCICVFTYDREKEALSLVQRVDTVKIPRHFVVAHLDQDEHWLVVAGQSDNKVVMHKVTDDVVNGPLQIASGEVLKVGTPVWLEIWKR